MRGLSGYRDRVEDLKRPRGRILWGEYASGKMPTGRWDTLPCRFPDLGADPRLRGWVRWGLERVRADLVTTGGRDPVATGLAQRAATLLLSIPEKALFPSRRELELAVGQRTAILAAAVGLGLQALGWLVDERGLGGGRELDGLAWTLPLERLWELYVVSHVARVARASGGQLLVGHKGQTVFPLRWSDPSLRSLGHLRPDIILRRHEDVRVFDAKYKAHLAELDEVGWLRMADEIKSAHRSDMHQVLAYASLFDARRITATLVYPIRPTTYVTLASRGHDVARAQLFHGGRELTLELQGLPFGSGLHHGQEAHLLP